MNFLQWLAGADPQILNQCSKGERFKISGFGTLVIMPAVVGIFSMTYAVSTLTDNKLIYVAAGLVWFFIVLFIDRFIVSTLYKTKIDSKSNFYLATASRYVFALLVGIAVSHPLTLLWFDNSITQEISNERNLNIENQELMFNDNINSLRNSLTNLENRKTCLEHLLTAELAGVKISLECGVSSGYMGESFRASELRRQISDLDQQIILEENRISNSVLSLSEAHAEIKNNISENTSYDYLKRVQTLSKIETDPVSGSHIKFVRWFLMLFFIVIEILPITMKIATPYGEYEAVRDSKLYKLLKFKEIENSVMETIAPTAYSPVVQTQLEHEHFRMEIENLSDLIKDTNEKIENSRQNSDDIAKKIIENITDTEDAELRKNYTRYFVSYRETIADSLAIMQQKFLHYMKSL